MKLNDILLAAEPLKRLSEKHFVNFKAARDIAILRKKMKTEVEFYVAEEKKIVETYASKDEHGNPVILEGGRIRLDSLEDKERFEKEIEKLRDLDVEIGKVTLSRADFRSAEDFPTPNDILALDLLVEFREE